MGGIILPGMNGKRSNEPDIHDKLNRLKAENIQMTKAFNLLYSHLEDLKKRVRRLEKNGRKQG